MKRNIINLLLLFIPWLAFTGCRKDLCYDHDSHGFGYRVDVAAEWEREWERPYGYDWINNWPAEGMTKHYEAIRPDKGEGIAAILFERSGDGSLRNVRELHIPSTGAVLSTTENTGALLFYNDDYEYIILDGMTTLEQASARTRTRSRSSFTDLHSGERTVSPPDMLYGHFVSDHTPEYSQTPAPLPVRMQPLVYTYVVRFKIESGAQHVALARGALAGMAESVYLHDGSTGDSSATLLFDCEMTDYGAIAHVMSFGVPSFPGDHYGRADGTGTEPNYALNLELKLNNGKMLTFDFDITDQMKDQPRGGVITVDGVTVSDEDAKMGGSMFDVTVDDWGEYEDIELPF